MSILGRILQHGNLKGVISIPTTVYVDSEPDTYILVDDYGNEVVAIASDDTITLDASANDIRLGKTAITVKGVTKGSKVIPSYNTQEGVMLIPAGSKFEIHAQYYEYTKLQALLCKFNSTVSNSVATDKVSIDGSVYPTDSTEAIATVITNSENKTIDLGIVNDDTRPYLIRYFTYKEIY